MKFSEKKIKKTLTAFLSLLTAFSLSFGALVGCGGGATSQSSSSSSSSSSSKSEESSKSESAEESEESSESSSSESSESSESSSGDSSNSAEDSAGGGSGEQKPESPRIPPDEPTEEETFVPVFRLVVYSDIHLTRTNSDNAKNFTEAIRASYTWASAHESYTEIDAFAVTGDLTHVGGAEPQAFADYKAILDAEVKSGTPVISMLGNHDIYANATTGAKGADEYVKAGLQLDQSINVKGFQLIGLSTTDGNGTFTDEQISFMEAELAKANAADPEKPVFTFQHQKLENTVYGCSGWNSATSSAKLDGAYAKYSQVINFSGHSHTQAASPRSVYQDNYTVVDVGALAGVSLDKADRFTFLDGETFVNSPVGTTENRYGRIVEVDENNRVRIRTFCPFTGEMAKTPSNLDDPEKELVFRIDDVTDKESFYYTDGRKEKAKAPYFAENSAITVIYNLCSTENLVTVKMSLPQMLDGSCPYLYRVVALPKNGGKAVAQYYFDQYYDGNAGNTEILSVKGLTPGAEYEIAVYPVNIWGLEGEPLRYTVTAAQASGR